MTIRTLYDALCERVPLSQSAAFDLDGLQLCPDPAREVRRIVCALDVTEDSVRYAIDAQADLLLTHHPILFSPVRTLDPDSSMDAKNATALLAAGIAHISLHTRFDAAEGGINDTLAALFGLSDPTGFGHADEPVPLGRQGDVPAQSAEDFARTVADALGCHVSLVDAGNPVRRVAVVGGSAGDYAELLLDSDADLLVTGELAHHRLLAAAQAGKSVVCAGHYHTEICFVSAVRPLLEQLAGEADILPFYDTAHERCIAPN